MSRSEQYAQARAALEELPSTLAACRAYLAAHPKHPPDYLSDTRRKRRTMTRRAYADGTGWAARLAISLERPALFTLHASHLGLEESDSDPAAIFDASTVARWRAAIAERFTGPCRWKLEGAARLHAHVLADESDGPADLPRGGEVVKAAHDLEGLVEYLSKPALAYTAESLHIWLEARRTLRRLPRLSGVLNLARDLATAETTPAKWQSTAIFNRSAAPAPQHPSGLREYLPPNPYSSRPGSSGNAAPICATGYRPRTAPARSGPLRARRGNRTRGPPLESGRIISPQHSDLAERDTS